MDLVGVETVSFAKFGSDLGAFWYELPRLQPKPATAPSAAAEPLKVRM